MSDNYVVGYDGSAASKRAVEFALNRAKASGSTLTIAHILEWSPYTFLTPEELEERHKRRSEELERAQVAVLDPIEKETADSGVKVNSVIKYGHVADMLCAIAKENGSAQIFIGRSGDSQMATRLFGSVAGSLAQTAPVPCTIVP